MITVGLDVAAADWIGASSDDELVDIIIDKTTTPPTLRWSSASPAGSATVTVMATAGSAVVYRSFTAGFAADGQPVSSPLEFVSGDELIVIRPPHEDGESDVAAKPKASSAHREGAMGVGVTVSFIAGGIAAVWVLQNVCCLKQEGDDAVENQHKKLVAEDTKLLARGRDA